MTQIQITAVSKYEKVLHQPSRHVSNFSGTHGNPLASGIAGNAVECSLCNA